jgi:predicted nucleic acid-binding protein
MTVLPLTEGISAIAFRLVDSPSLSHAVRLPDALIAATALERAMPLFTRNERHFRPIPGLTVRRPYS